MSSERLSAVLDYFIDPSAPINRLITRLEEEIDLGYYDYYTGPEMLRKCIKWAKKYRDGEA